MKYLLIAMLLSGCAAQSTTDTIAESAINATTAIEQSLPKQCATSAIKTQITALKTQINAIVQACDTEKAVIEQEKIRWKWAFLGLALVILVYFARRITSRI